MTNMIRGLTTSLALMVSLLASVPIYAETAIAEPDWYLVDEIIEDEAPDYRSDIFFADKVSIKPESGYTSVSISHIVMAQVEDDGAQKSEIKDLRSRILIDCNQHTYAVMSVAEYNSDNEQITSQTMSLETAEWILPFANSGYVSVFRFACEPDQKFVIQRFPGHIQPLAWVLAYLNADWSN